MQNEQNEIAETCDFSVFNEHNSTLVYKILFDDFKKRKIAAKLAAKCMCTLDSIDDAVGYLAMEQPTVHERELPLEASEQLTWANMDDLVDLNSIRNTLMINSN